MSEPFIGEIRLWSGSFEPRGWAFCDGRMMAIMDNQPLYSILMNNYGGDGRTTFALPDLRGRIPMGVGRGPTLTPRVLGASGGMEKIPLAISNLPAHTHNASVQNVNTTNNLNVTAKTRCKSGGGRSKELSPADAILMTSQVADNKFYTKDAPDSYMSDQAIEASLDGNIDVSVTVVDQNTGGDLPHNNVQPFLVLNYIIALSGLYPSRS